MSVFLPTPLLLRIVRTPISESYSGGRDSVEPHCDRPVHGNRAKMIPGCMPTPFFPHCFQMKLQYDPVISRTALSKISQAKIPSGRCHVKGKLWPQRRWGNAGNTGDCSVTSTPDYFTDHEGGVQMEMFILHVGSGTLFQNSSGTHFITY